MSIRQIIEEFLWCLSGCLRYVKRQRYINRGDMYKFPIYIHIVLARMYMNICNNIITKSHKYKFVDILAFLAYFAVWMKLLFKVKLWNSPIYELYSQCVHFCFPRYKTPELVQNYFMFVDGYVLLKYLNYIMYSEKSSFHDISLFAHTSRLYFIQPECKKCNLLHKWLFTCQRLRN